MSLKRRAAVLARVVLLALTAAATVLTASPRAQAGGAQDQVAAVKQSLQQGLTRIRNYEWMETTIISLKGEEKARKQNRCYYGADGKVEKVPVEQPVQAQEQQGGRGGRRGGRLKQQIIENKKDDMKEYMEKAAALIQQYVPPDPAKIQAAKDAQRVATASQAGGKLRLTIADYLQPKDSLTIDVDPATSQLAGLGVHTYLERPEDAVTLAVQMNALADGALYAAQTTLEAKAKNITVVIQNTGHRPVQR